MALLVKRDEVMPLVEVQAAEIRMGSAISAEIAISSAFEEIGGDFANGGERFELRLLVANEFGLQGNRRFDAPEAITRSPKRNVKPFQE